MNEMLDRQAIVDLTIAYCYALDQRDFDALGSVFTPDAKADYVSIFCNGLDEITEKVRSSVTPLDATTHMVSNHVVRLAGDAATCTCYLLSQHLKAGTPGGDLYTIAGRYDDELVRTPDGWRIAVRRLARIWSDGNREVARR